MKPERRVLHSLAGLGQPRGASSQPWENAYKPRVLDSVPESCPRIKASGLPMCPCLNALSSAQQLRVYIFRDLPTGKKTRALTLPGAFTENVYFRI